MSSSRVATSPQSGFSLVELIVVVVILGLLATVAAGNYTSPRELSLSSQAETLASAIRYTQALANSSGQSMSVTFTGNSYSASCAGTCPHNFSIDVEKDVALAVLTGAPNPLIFNTLGQPVGITSSAGYTLTSPDGSGKTVTVTPLTGFVTVTQ